VSTAPGACLDPGARVLVTGGAGFIGRHLCRALVRAGVEPTAWVRPGPEPLADLGAGVTVRAVDVRRPDQVGQALGGWPPDLVFHLAGLRLLGHSAEQLSAMFETHALGALYLAQGLRPEARMVVVGSGEEYGRGPVPFHESQPGQTRTAYAVSRLATTLACLELASPSVCVARLAVVYGPQQTGPMFIPSLFAAATAGRPFEMTRGEQTRDFLYVDDAVDALLALARCDAARGQVVNVGSGVETPVRQVAEQAVRLMGEGVDLRIGAIPSRPGEADRYLCSIERITALTGWRPTVDLAQGLARTLDWWRREGAR
jgi:nucleoside-diphosphate-sugar epimerase